MLNPTRGFRGQVNLTRKALKQDKFAVEVEHTVDYFRLTGSRHSLRVDRAGDSLIAGAGILLPELAASVREQVLGRSDFAANAPVGRSRTRRGPSFPTDAAKNDAVTKAFNKIVSDYGGSEEGYLAEYYFAGMLADTGKTDEARKKYQDVADHADANTASLAKLALAQIDAGENAAAKPKIC